MRCTLHVVCSIWSTIFLRHYIHVYTCNTLASFLGCLKVQPGMHYSRMSTIFHKSQKNNPVHVARCARIPMFYGNNAHTCTSSVYQAVFFKWPGNEANNTHAHHASCRSHRMSGQSINTLIPTAPFFWVSMVCPRALLPVLMVYMYIYVHACVYIYMYMYVYTV